MVIDHVTKVTAVSDGVVLAPSTVHRTLSLAGLMQKKPGEPTPKDRRRFSFEMAGELVDEPRDARTSGRRGGRPLVDRMLSRDCVRRGGNYPETWGPRGGLAP